MFLSHQLEHVASHFEAPGCLGSDMMSGDNVWIEGMMCIDGCKSGWMACVVSLKGVLDGIILVD